MMREVTKYSTCTVLFKPSWYCFTKSSFKVACHSSKSNLMLITACLQLNFSNYTVKSDLSLMYHCTYLFNFLELKSHKCRFSALTDANKLPYGNEKKIKSYTDTKQSLHVFN